MTVCAIITISSLVMGLLISLTIYLFAKLINKKEVYYGI